MGDKNIAKARKKIPGVKYVNQIAVEGTTHLYFCETYRVEKSVKEKKYNKTTTKTMIPSANAGGYKKKKNGNKKEKKKMDLSEDENPYENVNHKNATTNEAEESMQAPTSIKNTLDDM